MIVAGLLMIASAQAFNEKPIERNQLPQAAQQVLDKNFSNRKVAMAKMDHGLLEKSYDVVFTNGDKIEFDHAGEWTDITCHHSSVPQALVPGSIRTYLKSHYPDSAIQEIEKKRMKYEVKLSNGLEITFNKNFQVTDIDD